MIVRFNPTGTHIHKGFLKLRLDLIPEVGSPIFGQNIANFICVPDDLTLSALNDYIAATYTPELLNSIEYYMQFPAPQSGHYLSPLMRPRNVIAKVPSGLRNFNQFNNRFSDVNVQITPSGEVIVIASQTIDVGDDPIDRASVGANLNTLIAFTTENSANATGTIDTVQLWFNTTGSITGGQFGTMYNVSGANFSSRDYESAGTVTGGSLQSVTGLSIDIQTGDYLAMRTTTNPSRLERDNAGGSAWTAGAAFPVSNVTFTETTTERQSLYGTGLEAGSALTITPVDSMTIADATSQGFGAKRTEAFSLADVFSRASTYVLTPSDALSLADVHSRAATYLRTAADTLVLADALGKTLGLTQADAFSLADALVSAISGEAAIRGFRHQDIFIPKKLLDDLDFDFVEDRFTFRGKKRGT